jgi:mannose/cellobiose epimerase-like protein (N-acyl-D-glucosamine 2-epimerase family)
MCFRPLLEPLRKEMMDMDDSRVPGLGAVISIQNQLLRWLCDHALPFWDRHGVDRHCGGYFESIALTGPQRRLEVTGDVRRGRVVARQIYVFDAGHRLGWRSTMASPVDHGCEYLFLRLHLGDGVFHTAVDADSNRPTAPFSLYEQAFYLFVLARLNATRSDRYPIAATAALCLERLRSDCGRTNSGFEESSPATLPLKSNPHMHLLEAALAWIDVTEGTLQRPWIELAEELVALCLAHFADLRTGAVREYFDQHWQPVAGEQGRIVEPGHQFEWAWLLMQWASTGYGTAVERQACFSAAERLLEVGERFGVDPARGVAFNELWDDMTPKDPAAKLWPQTERIKAWCAMLERAKTVGDAELACQKIALAAQGLSRYFLTEPAGLWHEVMLPDGRFTSEPSKASSFYHIVCAIETLQKTLSKCRTVVL